MDATTLPRPALSSFEHGPEPVIADEPVEARGRRRDDVRLLVAHRSDGTLEHARFADLAAYLSPGDVLVVNSSATLPAAVPTADGALLVHLSTHLGKGRWVVEVRRPCGAGSRPHTIDRPTPLPLAGGGLARLRHRYGTSGRLWVAELITPVTLADWLDEYGRPIRYGCTDTSWPVAAYQTMFAVTGDDLGPGSAEMPSAARGFTPELVAQLIAAGVVFAPITLHTGVSSLEAHEPPYAERYRVPATTARLVNEAHRAGSRVVAVGTTATRALETDATADGQAHPGEGWTELVITPERGVHVVDGIISGWHEPEASHLMLMEAVAGRDLLDASYAAALAEGYLWHEFGDLHLVLPD